MSADFKDVVTDAFKEVDAPSTSKEIRISLLVHQAWTMKRIIEEVFGKWKREIEEGIK